MMKRLIVATLLGIVVSAVVLFARLSFADRGALAMVDALLGGWSSLEAFGLILALLITAGGIPTVLIGAALTYLRKASPVTLVLTPAILFLMILVEVSRETHDATLALDCLPAMACGGMAMYLRLARRAPVQQPVEAVFE